MRSILTYLLLCASVRAADPVADIKHWHRDGLIVVSQWNTGGFTFDWHVQQVRDGYRLLPTVKLPVLMTDALNVPAPTMTTENELFLRNSGLPLCLRTDNVATAITRLPRLPKVIDNLPQSPVVWTLKAGVLDDEAIADVFGPVRAWNMAGAQWSQIRLMRELQDKFPDTAYLVFADNNEANRDRPQRYFDPQTDAAGRAIQLPDGTYLMKWKPLDIIERLSIRTRDFAATHTIDEYREVSAANHNERYNALFASFAAALGNWQGKPFLTEGYGVGTFTMTGDIDVSTQYDYQFGHYDGGGSSLYISGDADSQWNGRTTLSDFTSPAWFKVYHLTPSAERAEKANPRHFRETFLMMSGLATYNGLQRGRHAMLTPDAWAGQLQWLLWSIKGDKRPVMLRYWLGNGYAPSTPMYQTQASIDAVTALGYPEIANGTQEMYVRPLMQAVNTILDNPTLRKFWTDGTPVCTGTHPELEIRWKAGAKPVTYPIDGPNKSWRLLDVDVNTPRDKWINPPTDNSRGGYSREMQVKVWGTAIEREDETLVHLWTPCKLDGSVTFKLPGKGAFTVPAPQQNAYWVVKPQTSYTVQQLE